MKHSQKYPGADKGYEHLDIVWGNERKSFTKLIKKELEYRKSFVNKAGLNIHYIKE